MFAFAFSIVRRAAVRNPRIVADVPVDHDHVLLARCTSSCIFAIRSNSSRVMVLPDVTEGRRTTMYVLRRAARGDPRLHVHVAELGDAAPAASASVNARSSSGEGLSWTSGTCTFLGLAPSGAAPRTRPGTTPSETDPSEAPSRFRSPDTDERTGRSMDGREPWTSARTSCSRRSVACCPAASPGVVVGVGDDAAVLDAGPAASWSSRPISWSKGCTSTARPISRARPGPQGDRRERVRRRRDGRQPALGGRARSSCRRTCEAAWVMELYGGMREACDEYALCARRWRPDPRPTTS